MSTRADSTDLAELLWGTIPVSCELAAADTRNQGVVRKCSFLVPRQGYLFLVLDHLRAEFLPFVNQDQTLWLSCDGLAVPWQYPVSAWLDMIAARRGVSSVMSILPLNLTAHFSRDEAAEVTVQTLSDPRMGRLLVYERLKCSSMMRFGSIDALKHLREHRRQDYDDLFVAVKNNESRAFAAARRRLEVRAMSFAVDGESSKRSATGTDSALVPICLHIFRGGAARTPTQTMLRSVTGSKRSFGAVLKELLPSELDALTSEECYADEPLVEARFGIVLVQGMSLYLSTPVDVLYEGFAAVDGLLHISAHLSSR